MKIRRVKLYDISVPFGDAAYTMGKRKSISSITGSVVSMETDEGITGWGEMVPWGSTYLLEFAEGVRAGLALLSPKLIAGARDQDIFDETWRRR
jgi:L-alanine-DL-glutamate epimerase-like enolase superfamily enzyme